MVCGNIMIPTVIIISVSISIILVIILVAIFDSSLHKQQRILNA